MIGDKLEYNYINTSVPKEKINYSYSKYGGESFLNSYKQVRESIISDSIINEPYSIGSKLNSPTEILFISWINDLGNNNKIKSEYFDTLLKRFEVTKKIYNEYDSNYRPIDKTAYNEYRLYVLFAYILVLIYKKTKKLQYLNALLKVNDINVSIHESFSKIDNILSKYCIKKELDFTNALMDKLL